MWVRQSAHDQGLDPVLFQTVRDWLPADWSFALLLWLVSEPEEWINRIRSLPL